VLTPPTPKTFSLLRFRVSCRRRTSVRVNAATTPIQGDGKVLFAVSKEEFEAHQTAAGDNLVRACPPS
jgi:hypothetical protein